jgi:hypothetical protein
MMNTADKNTASLVARVFGCTVKQVQKQYAKNRKQLRQMAKNPCNGYTGAELLRMAKNHKAI